MILTGKYGSAKVFTENIESEAISQVIELLNQEWLKGSKIAIMPDVHAGKGCTVGTTIKLMQSKIAPSLVGVDIGCGMTTVELGTKDINFIRLDDFIRTNIPSGSNIRSEKHYLTEFMPFDEFRKDTTINIKRAELSLGTLGGGNHFIEIAKSETSDKKYLIIHSGSRHLGLEVCNYYVDKAYNKLTNKSKEKDNLVKTLQKEGRHQEIEAALKSFGKVVMKKELAYLEGEDFDDYINDMVIAQEFAYWNRRAMAVDICDHLSIKIEKGFDTVHNYIDTSLVVRKGAVSAQKGEKLLIPLNMMDGSLLCEGKGNPKWNYSAPHGAGRIMSRAKAKEMINLGDFIESMKDIYTTSVSLATLDEAPQAYKDANELISNIGETVKIIDKLKPIYNFKAS